MKIQDVIDYVLETPGNTNPVILRQMIEELGGADTEEFERPTMEGPQ